MSEYTNLVDHIPDTWQEVLTVMSGNWEWREFRAYWSPDARRFFWLDDQGCSCDAFGDNIELSDMQDGNRDALLDAISDFFESEHYPPGPGPAMRHDVIQRIRRWRPQPAAQ